MAVQGPSAGEGRAQGAAYELTQYTLLRVPSLKQIPATLQDIGNELQGDDSESQPELAENSSMQNRQTPDKRGNEAHRLMSEKMAAFQAEQVQKRQLLQERQRTKGARGKEAQKGGKRTAKARHKKIGCMPPHLRTHLWCSQRSSSFCAHKLMHNIPLIGPPM